MKIIRYSFLFCLLTIVVIVYAATNLNALPGDLTFIAKQITGQAPTMEIISNDDKSLYVTNYLGKSIYGYNVNNDGSLSFPTQF
jgi:6-phosphogluconolactonase (cycloisomerase 2 family)